jgi:hypothetical protein
VVLSAAIGHVFAVGHLDVAGDALSGFQGDHSYTHYRVSISRTIQSFTFGVTYYVSSSNCESKYGGPILFSEGICTPRVVFTLSRTFCEPREHRQRLVAVPPQRSWVHVRVT